MIQSQSKFRKIMRRNRLAKNLPKNKLELLDLCTRNGYKELWTGVLTNLKSTKQ